MVGDCNLHIALADTGGHLAHLLHGLTHAVAHEQGQAHAGDHRNDDQDNDDHVGNLGQGRSVLNLIQSVGLRDIAHLGHDVAHLVHVGLIAVHVQLKGLFVFHALAVLSHLVQDGLGLIQVAHHPVQLALVALIGRADLVHQSINAGEVIFRCIDCVLNFNRVYQKDGPQDIAAGGKYGPADIHGIFYGFELLVIELLQLAADLLKHNNRCNAHDEQKGHNDKVGHEHSSPDLHVFQHLKLSPLSFFRTPRGCKVNTLSYKMRRLPGGPVPAARRMIRHSLWRPSIQYILLTPSSLSS